MEINFVKNTETSRSQLILDPRERDKSGSVDSKRKQSVYTSSVGKSEDKKVSESKKEQTETSQQVSEEQQGTSQQIVQRKSKFRVRMAGLFLLVLLFGIMWPYGFSGTTSTGYFSNENHYYVGLCFFIACIFTVMGFGLLFAYHGQNLFSGFFTALYIVSITILVSPLVQKLWFNIFIGNFKTGIPQTTPTNIILYTDMSGSNILFSYGSIKIALTCAISQLLIHLAVLGRMQIYKTIFSSIIFIIMWNLNYFLCINILKLSPDNRFFDDYSINMVYLFGSCNALLMSLDVPSNLKLKPGNPITSPMYTKIFSFMGLAFLWMSFCFTNSITGIKQETFPETEAFRSVFYPEGSLNIFFALCSSLISTVAFSIAFGKKKIHFSDLFLGSISGAIIFGSVSSFVTNIAAPITVGIFSGLVSVFYKQKMMKKLNKKHIYDSLGLFGSVGIVSLFGVVAVAPLVIHTFYFNQVRTTPMGATSVKSSSEAPFILIFAGISAGIGLISGMINSTILRCLDALETRFGDDLMFEEQLSLIENEYDTEEFEFNEQQLEFV